MIWFTVALAAGGARPKGLAPARSTEEALNAALGPRRVALIVGIDRYDDPTFPDLLHAGADAELVAGVIEDPSMGGFDQVVSLAGSPSRDEVLTALRELTRDLRGEDVLLLYFSGHGTRLRVDGTWRRYLLERDSRAMALDTSAIELEALQGWFGALAPARKVMIVDACFDGGGKSVVRADDHASTGFGLDVPNAAALGTGEAYLFATAPGRAALEDDQLAHGVYTYYLMEALSWAFADADRDQDGVVTAWEAHDHARMQTLAWSKGAQVPEAAFRVVGMADVVLAGNPAARKHRDQSLVYLYSTESHPLAGGSVIVDGRPRGVLPGTVPIPPGRHHVELAAADGDRLADGWLRFEAGHPYRADDLTRLIDGPRIGIGARPIAVVAPGFVLGPGALGIEGYAYWRDDDAPGRGWTFGARAALLGADGPAGQRPGADLGVELGVQQDYRRLRVSAAASVGAVWWPPAVAGDGTLPDEHGWVFATVGPSIAGSAVLSESLAVGVLARPLVTVLDVDQDARVELVPWLTFGAQLTAVLR